MPAKRTKAKVTFTNEPFWVPLADVKPDPENANTHTQRGIEVIARSLLRFGFREPAVADSKGIIRAGNGRYEAVLWIERQAAEDEDIRNRALQKGILRPGSAGVLLPWMRCEVSSLEGYEAQAYALVDNQSAKLSELDMNKVVEIIGAARFNEPSINDFGFDAKAIAGMIAKVQPQDEAESVGQTGQLGEIKHKIIVECVDEKEQLELLEKFEKEGIKCQPLSL